MICLCLMTRQDQQFDYAMVIQYTYGAKYSAVSDVSLGYVLYILGYIVVLHGLFVTYTDYTVSNAHID